MMSLLRFPCAGGLTCVEKSNVVQSEFFVQVDVHQIHMVSVFMEKAY